jgi:hypothetical protein
MNIPPKQVLNVLHFPLIQSYTTNPHLDFKKKKYIYSTTPFAVFAEQVCHVIRLTLF